MRIVRESVRSRRFRPRWTPQPRVLGATPCDDEVTRLIHRSVQAPHASALGPRPSLLGVPQGSPLSPVISNAVLLPFDIAFSSVPASLFRYADDMLVLCKDAATAEQMHRHAVEVLSSIHLELNPTKTRIEPLEHASFLGFGFQRENGRWVRGLSQETRSACIHHLCRMEDTGKSLDEMRAFLRQWTAYFLPHNKDQARHATFLDETITRFRLHEDIRKDSARKSPPQGFSYSGHARDGGSYARLPWALRFMMRRVRFGLHFRRKGFIPVPSGLHITIAGHRIHFML